MLLDVLVIIVFLILLAIGVAAVAFAIYQSSGRRIGYIPLPQRAVLAVIEALKLGEGDCLIDLGCGDGRILAAALQRHPKLQAVGVELNPVVATLARRRLRRLNLKHPSIRIVRGNLLNTDLHAATRVFTYLNHFTMAALEPKLERELKPGTRLVSCDFPLPNRKPNQAITIGHDRQLGQTLYVYDYK